ncbi:MAG: hypoxanthine phosphoribosyltransferase [candidate division WOR-3 bacterium]|nr:hypoxanthine phosphoribosyltransferase [candidate division WOR-3 bacterium]MCX7837549.1 hypoxanthine phosphoribosyltransferase [candidate division WOR-3 bacterium]MDW8113637.1 hypoxanthine phosphoribosyltransferase [candidate division WOR-3 bacterium]
MNVKVFKLIPEEDIKNKVKELADRISKDYLNKELILIGILKGAFVFLADLMRNLTIPSSCDFIKVSSYGKSTESSGIVKIVADISMPIEDKDILLVEDIVDTGLTLQYLINHLSLKKPKSIKICALLDKPERHKIEIPIDYLGFTIPNKFVVGYGIDYDEKFRYLPYIGYIEINGEE